MLTVLLVAAALLMLVVTAQAVVDFAVAPGFMAALRLVIEAVVLAVLAHTAVRRFATGRRSGSPRHHRDGQDRRDPGDR